MKTFKASHLVKKPAEVFAEARKNGAIIQQCRTNGEIVEEFVMIAKVDYCDCVSELCKKCEAIYS